MSPTLVHASCSDPFRRSIITSFQIGYSNTKSNPAHGERVRCGPDDAFLNEYEISERRSAEEQGEVDSGGDLAGEGGVCAKFLI